MKAQNNFLVILTILFSLSPNLFADDPVDQLNKEYEEKIRSGLFKIYTRQRLELEDVKRRAMRNQNLDLANKADLKIKEIEKEIIKHRGPEAPTSPVGYQYPESSFYKMTWSNGRRGTEHGKEIICKFKRLYPGTPQKGKLTLTLKSAPTRLSNTPKDIFILNGSRGSQIGKLSGIGTGKTKKITLNMNPSDTHEIVVVVKAHEALHLRSFKDQPQVPELYLTIE